MSERQFSRDEAEQLAAAIASVDPDDPESYFSRVDKLLKERKVDIPCIRISYNSLTVVKDAVSSAGALPSLPNVLLGAAKALTCQKPKTEPLNILNNLTGSLEPGRLTLLLGPPSCGKSTFLRALAGRLPEDQFTGTIEYNGYKFSEFEPARTTTFVAQDDTHVPNLTARETVKFAYDIQDNRNTAMFKASAPHSSKAESVDAKPLQKVVPDNGKLDLRSLSDEDLEKLTQDALDGPGRVDTLMHLFGLLRCKDTWAGNRQTRGISGGERKRLSTVELLTGQQRALVLDEISTGLDAATLFEIIKWLRAMCHHLQMTVIISLLQPPPETFALFDDLMIINAGTIVYHDTVSDAVPFMEKLGFLLPPRKDVPSFLQEVTTVRGQIAYASPAMRAAQGMPSSVSEVDEIELSQMEPYVSLADMAAQGASLRSKAAKDLPSGRMGAPGEGALMPHSERVPLAWLQQLKLVLKRQATLFVRDPVLARARLMQCVMMGLIIGGLWFDLGTDLDDTRTYMSAMFMTVLFFSFGGMPQLAMALQNRTVWFKQRGSNLYSATSYAWCMSLVQLPLSILEALIFTTITYFMIGFSTDGPQYYFLFLTVCVSVSMAITSLFRLLGCAFSSATAAQGVGGFFLLLLIVNSGFIIVRSSIPPWVICFYWISPFAYSIRALVVNEFTSPRWDRQVPNTDRTIGVAALESLDFFTERKWIGIAIAFNLAVFVLLTNAAALCLAYLKPPFKPVTITHKEDLKASLQEAKKAKEEAHALLTKKISAGKSSLMPSSINLASRKSGLDVGSSLEFTPITVCWRDLSYYVPVAKGLTGAAALNIMPDDAGEDIAGKKRLLNNITGYAEPGVLCALMGGSGAGKTTLMDVLAGRKNQGVIKGDLMINGHPKVQETWARVVGYVEQVDIHSEALTVEESLQFSAGLRLTPDVDERTRAAYILEVLLVTELMDIKGNLVGTAGETGLSVEQRRRLSIGVELVANPSVVFMDEPTSGLDARSAAAVIHAVRNVAANGRTVMVTIHQPSIEIFEAFDRLVLLAMGGDPIFCGNLGTQSKSLVEYFEGIPGVPALPDNYNPATWMLEVSGGAAKMNMAASTTQDFPAVYRSSSLHKANTTRVDDLITRRAATHKPLSLASRYAVSFVQQTKMVTWKMFILYWRFPSYTVARIFVSVLTAVVFGATWYDEGTIKDEPASFKDVQNIIGNLYSSLSFLGMANLLAGVPAFIAERAVMYRERASSMYAVLPYGIATGLVEIPYLLVQSMIFVPVIYFTVGFRVDAEAFFLFVVIFTESIALYTFMGQFFAYLAPTAAVATVLGGINHFLWNIFNGFLVPSPLMAKGWVWLNYISATTYVIYSLAASQMGDNEKKIVLPGFSDYPGCRAANLDACPSVKQFVEDYFGYEYNFRWWCALILLCFVFFFRVAAMVVLKVVNHERR